MNTLILNKQIYIYFTRPCVNNNDLTCFLNKRLKNISENVENGNLNNYILFIENLFIRLLVEIIDIWE